MVHDSFCKLFQCQQRPLWAWQVLRCLKSQKVWHLIRHRPLNIDRKRIGKAQNNTLQHVSTTTVHAWAINQLLGLLGRLCLIQSNGNQDKGLSVCDFQIQPILKAHCIPHARRLFCAIFKCHTIVSIKPSTFHDLFSVIWKQH